MLGFKRNSISKLRAKESKKDIQINNASCLLLTNGY